MDLLPAPRDKLQKIQGNIMTDFKLVNKKLRAIAKIFIFGCFNLKLFGNFPDQQVQPLKRVLAF
jgi:hypothetical protein